MQAPANGTELRDRRNLNTNAINRAGHLSHRRKAVKRFREDETKRCDVCGNTFSERCVKSPNPNRGMYRMDKKQWKKARFCSIECLNTERARTRGIGKPLKVQIGKGIGRVRVLAHRLAAETSVGRKLKPLEVVHHLDSNRENNDASNLFLFRNNGAHSRWHRFLERHGLDGKILESNLDQYACT